MSRTMSQCRMREMRRELSIFNRRVSLRALSGRVKEKKTEREDRKKRPTGIFPLILRLTSSSADEERASSRGNDRLVHVSYQLPYRMSLSFAPCDCFQTLSLKSRLLFLHRGPLNIRASADSAKPRGQVRGGGRFLSRNAITKLARLKWTFSFFKKTRRNFFFHLIFHGAMKCCFF